MNDGTKVYDHDEDGKAHTEGGCQSFFRNLESPTYVRISYWADLKAIQVDVDTKVSLTPDPPASLGTRHAAFSAVRAQTPVVRVSRDTRHHREFPNAPGPVHPCPPAPTCARPVGEGGRRLHQPTFNTAFAVMSR